MKKIIAIFLILFLTKAIVGQGVIEEISSGNYFYSLPNNEIPRMMIKYNGDHFDFRKGEDKRIFEFIANSYQAYLGIPTGKLGLSFSFDNNGKVLKVELVSSKVKDKQAVLGFLNEVKNNLIVKIDTSLIDEKFRGKEYYVGYMMPIK